MNWLCELSTTTCSSITEKKFKLSIEVFFLVVLIDIEIKDWFWCKWKNFLFINDTVVDNILFFLFICKQHTYILYIISTKNVEKRWFYGILENKVRTFIGLLAVRGRKSCDNTWVKKRTNVGWPENQRKSRLWAKKKAYLGKEKGIFGSYICPLKRKKS